LDSEGLAKWAAGDRGVRSHLEVAQQLSWPVVVPPTALAEVLRGIPADASVNRLLAATWQTFLGPRLARDAGRLLARAGLRGATADAFVVAEASRHGLAIILTSDAADFEALSAGNPRVEIVPV
jgi:hypothetical protein